MKSSKLFLKFLLLGLILIFGLASGCDNLETQAEQSPILKPELTLTLTPTPRPTHNIPPIEKAPFYSCSLPEKPPGFTGKKGAGIMEGQIILTGIPDDILSIKNIFNKKFNSDFEPIEIDLSLDSGEPHLAIHLYQLIGGIDVWEVVREINTYIRTNQEETKFVFAEPNYVTTLPISASDPCGGCSGGIVGDPTGVLTPLEFGKREFLNQWAFSFNDSPNGSIDLFDSSKSWTAKGSKGKPDYTGENIEIVIFDTVPSDFLEGNMRIKWASVPFDLCVWKPGYIFDSKERSHDKNNIDLQDHGLFVTGLAQGVAPEARYTLIEVLNSEAEGDVVSLLYVMNEYLLFEREIEDFNLNNTVINFSLGLELEIRRMQFSEDVLLEIQAALEPLKALLEQTLETSEDWGNYIEGLNKRLYPSVALNIALSIFEQNGAMIVAAAGNDQRSLAQTPAGLPSVLGVSSNNYGQGLSCFSNAGDVAAPGGEGSVPGCNMDMNTLCREYIKNGNIGKCPYAVISLTSKNPAVSGGGRGFGYWTGTSMSTPIVSGLSALLFEQCQPITPAGIRDLIENAAILPTWVYPGLGAGIINVEKTIALNCKSKIP